MKKLSLVRGLTALTIISCTVTLTWFGSAHAVELFHQSQPQNVPVQPVAVATSSLPEIRDVVKQVKDCVVNISIRKKATHQIPRFGGRFGRGPSDDFFERFFQGQRPQQERRSLGSGFVINEQGNILTNRHVIAGADEVTVHTSQEKKYTAKVVGEDEKTDIAVLKVEAKNLPYCTLGNSDQVEVGQWAMAMGNPFGLDSTVTVGIVSAKGRVIGAGPYDDFIQTDASINPGNSGGPLFDLYGRVIGINTAIVASGQGIGFAIPINMAKDLTPQLIKEGKVTRGWLGVGIQDMTEELAKSFDLKEKQGGLVASVFPNSPASKAGVQAGDIILKFNGKAIKESHNLPAEVARTKIGSTVPIEVLRNGQRKTLQVKIAQRDDQDVAAQASAAGGNAGLGVEVRSLTPEEKRELGLAQGQGGVYINRVEPGSDAARSDVRPGDILISVNGKAVKQAPDYGRLVAAIKKGQVVRFFLKRGQATVFVAFQKG